MSDLPDKALLAPFAVAEQSGQRHLQPFEASTQEEAIAAGKRAMRSQSDSADAWAFAREGSFREGKEQTDVIVIDFWAKGMNGPMTLIQRFERFTKHGRFKLLGDPIITMGGDVVSLPADTIKAQLRRGHQSTFEGRSAWDTWH